MSRLFRNDLYLNSLEMSSSNLIQVMLGWCVEVGYCIFSRDDPGEGRRRRTDASILYEVPHQKGNEGY